MSQAASPNPLRSFLGSLSGADQLRMEKSRLEAFLAAFPGEYCGFAPDGSVIYSTKFPSLLRLEKIEKIYDIQNALSAGDSSVLEGMFIRLNEKGKRFSIEADTADGKSHLRISGARGLSLDGEDHFVILWIENITSETKTIKEYKNIADNTEYEIERLQNSLDTMPNAFWIRNSRSELTWVNSAYAEIVDDSPATVLVSQKEISFAGKSKSTFRNAKELAQAALQKGEPLKMNAHIISGGKRHYIEITESPVISSDYTFGMIRDATREEELNTEMERYITANKTLLEQLRSSIGIFNANQELEFYNSSFAQLWSLDDQYLNGRPKLGDLLEKLRETRRLPEQADFRNYKKSWIDMFTGLIDPHEDMLYLPDGSAVRMLIVPHPMGGLMMTFEDVTSRLELESSYNTLIAVQKETLDNLAEGVAVYGGDGRLKLCNPSFAELWGLNPEDVQSEPHISSIVQKMEPLFEKQKWEEKKSALIAHGIERKVQEGRIARANKTQVEYATVPLPDGGVLVSYFDVTDAIQVENALRERNAALEEAEELKTDFLANVSYQLRTPLNAIMGFAEILDNEFFGQLNDKQKEYSSGIQDAGQKLVRLIDDILDLSTIEAGYMDLNMSEFNVLDILEGLHELTKEWALKERINVKLDVKDSVGTLVADERRIKQIMLNLIHNAINFTPEKGTIIIAAKRLENVMQLSVTDNGVGIPEKDLDRIFEPFERVVVEHRTDMSSTALSKGAGLGLSLVKNIAELHGGNIEIQSKEEQGTTVVLTFPLQQDSALIV